MTYPVGGTFEETDELTHNIFLKFLDYNTYPYPKFCKIYYTL